MSWRKTDNSQPDVSAGTYDATDYRLVVTKADLARATEQSSQQQRNGLDSMSTPGRHDR